MLRKIAPIADKIILSKLKTARAELPDNMLKILNKIGRKAMVTHNIEQAIQKAKILAKKEDLICATGSLYLAGEVKQKFPITVSYGKTQ